MSVVTNTPSPTEFSAQEIAENPILRWFHYAHLPDDLRIVSAPFCAHARMIIDTIPNSAERTAGLRKLLEAKDCIVRAAMPQLPR